jgi:hypothetical protein
MFMERLIILLGIILLNACREVKKEGQIPDVQKSNSEKIFTAIEKDSAFYVTYKFDKQTNIKGAVVYKYSSDSVRSFSVVADTLTGRFNLIESTGDTSALHIEGERFFEVNGVDYKVFKLISGKDVTDGEVSYFFNTGLGVLLVKSNTWRIGQVLNPEKEETDYLQQITLLYKILTDQDFYQNRVPPESNIKKFTKAKVE